MMQFPAWVIPCHARCIPRQQKVRNWYPTSSAKRCSLDLNLFFENVFFKKPHRASICLAFQAFLKFCLRFPDFLATNSGSSNYSDTKVHKSHAKRNHFFQCPTIGFNLVVRVQAWNDKSYSISSLHSRPLKTSCILIVVLFSPSVSVKKNLSTFFPPKSVAYKNPLLMNDAANSISMKICWVVRVACLLASSWGGITLVPSRDMLPSWSMLESFDRFWNCFRKALKTFLRKGKVIERKRKNKTVPFNRENPIWYSLVWISVWMGWNILNISFGSSKSESCQSNLLEIYHSKNVEVLLVTILTTIFF